MRAERFMYFCIKNYIGTQGEDLPRVRCFKPHWFMLPTVLRRRSWCDSYFGVPLRFLPRDVSC